MDFDPSYLVERITVESRIVPISSLRPNTWNPNKQSAFIYEKTKRSIEVNGFVDPVTVRWIPGVKPGTNLLYEIIDGEHRWKAAIELGHTQISVINLKDCSDAKAKQLTIILNDLRGTSDMILLSRLVERLDKVVQRSDLELNLPFTQDQIENLLRMNDPDWNVVPPPVPKPSKGELDPNDYYESFRLETPKSDRPTVEPVLVQYGYDLVKLCEALDKLEGGESRG